MKFKRVVVFLMVFVLLVSMVGCGKKTEQFPSKPIEYVIPYGAGGATDTFARTVMDFLTKEKLVNVPFVVSNKPGGSTAVGLKYVQSKAGDPHLLLSVGSTIITGSLMSKETPSYKEFTALGVIAADPSAWAVSTKSPYKTLDDLIKAGKTERGITIALSSLGTIEHAVVLKFAKETGAKIVIMPNDSDNQAMTQVLGGNADVVSINPRLVLGQVQAGDMKILAVTSEKRIEGIDAPTFKELGFDISGETPRGIMAAGNISDDAKNFYIDSLKKLVETQRWKDYAKSQYLSSTVLFDKDYTDYIAKKQQELESLFKEAGVIK